MEAFCSCPLGALYKPQEGTLTMHLLSPTITSCEAPQVSVLRTHSRARPTYSYRRCSTMGFAHAAWQVGTQSLKHEQT